MPISTLSGVTFSRFATFISKLRSAGEHHACTKAIYSFSWPTLPFDIDKNLIWTWYCSRRMIPKRASSCYERLSRLTGGKTVGSDGLAKIAEPRPGVARRVSVQIGHSKHGGILLQGCYDIAYDERILS